MEIESFILDGDKVVRDNKGRVIEIDGKEYHSVIKYKSDGTIQSFYRNRKAV